MCLIQHRFSRLLKHVSALVVCSIMTKSFCTCLLELPPEPFERVLFICSISLSAVLWKKTHHYYDFVTMAEQRCSKYNCRRVPLFKVPLFKVPLFELPLFKVPLFKVPLFELPLFKVTRYSECTTSPHSPHSPSQARGHEPEFHKSVLSQR